MSIINVSELSDIQEPIRLKADWFNFINILNILGG